MAKKYINRVESKKSLQSRRKDFDQTYKLDPTDDVFLTIKPEDATGPAKNTFYRNS